MYCLRSLARSVELLIGLVMVDFIQTATATAGRCGSTLLGLLYVPAGPRRQLTYTSTARLVCRTFLTSFVCILSACAQCTE